MHVLCDTSRRTGHPTPLQHAAQAEPEGSVAGAAGGIGQPLALLLKGSGAIGELSLYDIVGTEGVGADLSHIDSSVKVWRRAVHASAPSHAHCLILHTSGTLPSHTY